jgi:hypothetical protein
MRRRKVKLIAIDPPNRGVACITQMGSVFGNRFQHRLNVGRRAGDDT